jgi:hypothetical protein
MLVNQPWDIQELLDDPIQKDLRAIGVPKGTLKAIASCETYSRSAPPSKCSKIEIDPRDRQAGEDSPKRPPPLGLASGVGLRVVVPAERGRVNIVNPIATPI